MTLWTQFAVIKIDWNQPHPVTELHNFCKFNIAKGKQYVRWCSSHGKRPARTDTGAPLVKMWILPTAESRDRQAQLR
jgi:hypothetical protein